MSASQRTKGAVGEREVCALLRDTFGVEAERNLSQTRDGGFDISCPPFSIEVKRRKRIANLYEWLGQAERPVKHVLQRILPTLFLRGDNREWLVVMRFEDWAQLAREELVRDMRGYMSEARE